MAILRKPEKWLSARIALLQQLPVCFVALLLRELIAYDWKFPPERKDLNRQLAYLESRSAEERRQLMESFERLRLSPELERLRLGQCARPVLRAAHRASVGHPPDRRLPGGRHRLYEEGYGRRAAGAASDSALGNRGGGPGSGGKPVPAISQAAAARSLLQPGKVRKRIPDTSGCRGRESQGASGAVWPLVYRRRSRAGMLPARG